MDHSTHNMGMHGHDHGNHPESTPKEYLKFTGVIFGIILISFLVHKYILNSLNWMQVFMGVFFLVFAAFKFVNLKAFVLAYMGYDIVARRSKTYAYAYPFIEVGMGAGSLMGWLNINYVIIFFMLVGYIGVTQQLLKKTNFQCACLGTVIKLPLSTVTLAEDLIMGFMAVMMII